MSGWVGRSCGRYSKCSMLGATQNATRALFGQRMTGGWLIAAESRRRGARVIGSSVRLLGRMCLEPIDALPAGGFPHALPGTDMAQHLVEVPDAPGLAHDPRMQVQDHHPPGVRSVGINAVKPLAPQQVYFIDRAPAVQVDVVVIEILLHAERVEFAGLRSHPVGLLVI